MVIDPDEVEDLLGTLDETHQKMERLREERDKLLEANQKLIELVKRIEEEVESLDGDGEHEMDEFSPDGYQYSYGEGWKPRDVVYKESLDLDVDLDTDDIDRQLGAVREMMDRIRNYKSQQAEE